MQRRIKMALYITLLFTLLLNSVAGAAAGPSLDLNGNSIVTDTPPIIKSGSTLVPIRVISEYLGAAVSWDQATQTATIIKDATTIKLTINKWNAVVNDKSCALNYPVTLYNSRTMVPIRFVAENLGCIVKWEQTAQQVKIFYLGSNLIKDGSAGEEVKGLQLLLNDCGIGMITVDGVYDSTTQDAVKKLQTEAGIGVDGIVGPATRQALNSKIGGVNIADPIQPSRDERYGTPTSWWTVNGLWPRGTVATVYDLDSGLSYQVKRLGGSNHADVEPLTAADTAKMLKAYGGEWAWTRHAIIVTYGQYRWAASQNGMPHSTKTIENNNFPGHFCIHFKDSMTHGGNQWAPSPAHVDAAHQAMVNKAAGR